MLNETRYFLILSTFFLPSISGCAQEGNKEDLEIKSLSYFWENIEKMDIIDYSEECSPSIHPVVVRYPKSRIINSLFASEPFEFYKYDQEINSEYTGVETLSENQNRLDLTDLGASANDTCLKLYVNNRIYYDNHFYVAIFSYPKPSHHSCITIFKYSVNGVLEDNVTSCIIE